MATGTDFTNTRPRRDPGARRTRDGRISREAILYEDGRLVKDPIALVEIQGCYYAAKQLIGLAFASLGDERRAADLLAQAERLKRRFNEKFWMPEERYFALALDPAKNLLRTIAADPGQCLAYGIIDEDKAEAVAARLMMPDLFSGWGIRTLSDRHPAFNPFAYHLGSVWPATNAIIGFGLKRYGFNKQLHHLAKAMFDAAQMFDLDRLPEVFGGQARDRRHPHPGIYPDANSPQAWSAGAVILLIHSMLGLIPVRRPIEPSGLRLRPPGPPSPAVRRGACAKISKALKFCARESRRPTMANPAADLRLRGHMKPANLLFILCDEHNPRVLGCAGHPMIRTPNLDRLAAKGVRFSDAYCNSPICVPSRAALATGRYVHRIRFWDNAIPYDGSVPSWHHRLREAGHEVTAIGKLHFRSAEDDNGFSRRDHAAARRRRDRRPARLAARSAAGAQGGVAPRQRRRARQFELPGLRRQDHRRGASIG